MSNALAVAVWRAKMARQTPKIVNIVDINESKLKEAGDRIAELEQINANLISRIGGLTTELNRRPPLIEEFVPSAAPKFLTISQVAEIVANEFRLSVLDMQSHRRDRDSVDARMALAYLARKFTNRSLPTIARFLGGRDHSTILHAVRKIGERRKQNGEMNSKLERLEEILSATAPQ